MTKTQTTEMRRDARRDRPWGRLSIGDDLILSRIGESQFAALVFERGLAHYAQMHWTTSATSLEPVLPYSTATARTQSRSCAVLDLERVVGDACLATVDLKRETVWVRIATAEQPAAAEAERWLRGCFEPDIVKEDEPPRVPVSFWSYGGCGTQVTRSIAVPVWSDIAGNYPRTVREGLERLFAAGHRPGDAGQLALWHGDPGTGKTYALRTLAWAWREWCDLHYVTDPDQFFGTRADYMMEVLLDEDDDDAERWRLLVLEDTGDLLTNDGGGGAGLSRLLNVVDGIVGQGLRVLVMVTTNEPPARLHPAVSRPGRCASRVEFTPFEPDEAEAWLERHGAPPGVPPHPTLARLYAHLRGHDLPENSPGGRRRVGFSG
jgi:hypothetical protein